jgi:hypothetical protein
VTITEAAQHAAEADYLQEKIDALKEKKNKFAKQKEELLSSQAQAKSQSSINPDEQSKEQRPVCKVQSTVLSLMQLFIY